MYYIIFSGVADRIPAARPEQLDSPLLVRLCQLNNDLEEMDEMVIIHIEQEIQKYYPVSPAPPDLCG